MIYTRQNLPSFFDLHSMLLVKENHASGSKSTQSDNQMFYMEADRPVGMVDEVGRHAIATIGNSRAGGTKIVLTAVLDPPQVGGVKVASRTDDQRLKWNVGTVARKATRRAGAGRSVGSI